MLSYHTSLPAGMDVSKCSEDCKLDPSKGDLLNELGVQLASHLASSVVSLASFNGDFTVNLLQWISTFT